MGMSYGQHHTQSCHRDSKRDQENEKRAHISHKSKSCFRTSVILNLFLLWRYYFDDIYETYHDLYISFTSIFNDNLMM